MKQRYRSFNFTGSTLDLIATMQDICTDYQRQGFVLTVRQLYYQLVARDIIPNNERSYKRVTGIANDARLAGLIDWDAIEDRTRAFVRRTRWESGSAILAAAASSFHMDMWDNQHTRVFVIIEKEALVGVLEPICRKLDVPLLAARGYPSGTVLREFAESDLVPAIDHGQSCTILHLGDHDPSGIDMTRDLTERLQLFSDAPLELELVRIALTMEQIGELKPPPNPAKTTDSRFESYMREYGDESWELDAIPPNALSDLVGTEIADRIDMDKWDARSDEVEAIRTQIAKVAKGFKS